MKFSIIIPVYNCEKYIEECVESIISSSSTDDYEILLIDDGSTDSSGTVCDKISQKRNKVVSFHKTNGGVSSARNCGLKNASGKYVLFIDCDDKVDVNILHELEQCLDGYTADHVIYGVTFEYISSERVTRREILGCAFSGLYDLEDVYKNYYEMFENNCFSAVWNKVFRLDIINKFHLEFDEKMIMYEDLDFSLRYINCCRNIFFLNRSLYRYRIYTDENKYLKRIDNFQVVTYTLDKLHDSLRFGPNGKDYTTQVLKIEQSIISQIVFQSLCSYAFHRNVFFHKLALYKSSPFTLRWIQENKGYGVTSSKTFEMMVNNGFYTNWAFYIYKRIKRSLITRIKWIINKCWDKT